MEKVEISEKMKREIRCLHSPMLQGIVTLLLEKNILTEEEIRKATQDVLDEEERSRQEMYENRY